MKKVILIGDSIRLSYNERVKQLLSDRAEVWGTADNCRFAKYTLWCVNSWINEGAQGKPDVIHWNNGIWDTFKISEDLPVFTPLDEYLHTMEQIYTELKKYNAAILFANTTPVGEKFTADNNAVIDRYNKAITVFMNEHGIPVNDLNSVVKADPINYIGEDLLHLSADGVEAVAQKVASFIGKYL